MRKLLTVLAFLLIFLTACNQTTEFKITFIENGGVALEDLTIKTTDTSFDLPTPVREGYTFDGWFTDEALTLPFSIASLLTRSGGITLYAKWTQIINQFTVTYQTNGGSTIAPVVYEMGETIVEPTQPTKIGYTFSGWFTDEALTQAYTFGPMPESNLTLYVKWIINPYTITFESNGGSTLTPITSDYQSTINKPTNPTKLGYTFVDWYLEPALTTPYVFSQMGSSDLTLYAKWNINSYTVTFEANQGSVVTSIATDYDTTITKPTDPTKVGHTFGGWYSDQTLTTAFVFTTPITQDITLYAKWSINSYTMTFDTAGGSPVNPVTQNYGSTITVPNPAKEGYDFAGWFSDQVLTTPYTINTMPDGNLTVYAKWTASPYTITFEANGGTAVTTISANYNDTITAPVAPTKTGHSFDGWYINNDLTTLFIFDTMPVGGATLYAKWNVNIYTITYVIEGSSIIEEIPYQSQITLNIAPVIEGYNFIEWMENDVAFIETTMPDRNITILPKYEPKYYQISFENITKESMLVQYNSAIVIQPPVRPGYVFIGWYMDELLLNEFTLTYMPANAIKLYAKFEPVSIELFLHIDEVTIETMSIAFESTYELHTPTKPGYQFLGWYTEDSFDNRVYEIKIGLLPTHLYALWQIDEGYDLIENIILTEPNDLVKVKGIISYLFTKPGFPGFYLYDGTANIFVLANPLGFVVGDIIEFEAYYDSFENTPQLINPFGMIISTGNYILPSIEPLDFEDIMRSDEMNPLIYGQRILIEAFLGYNGNAFYLQAPFSTEVIMINHRSILNNDVLMPYINQTVTMEAYIHDYQSMASVWHIAYIGGTINVIAYTPEALIDQVIALGMTQLEGRIFYPGATLQLPNQDPTYGTTLEWSVVGDNSAYFDLTTFTFQITDTERIIQFQCVITLQGTTKTAVFNLILKPDTFLTYQQFLALEINGYAKIKGVVLAHIGMIPATIISLDGYPIFIQNNQALNPGDEVIFVGYKQSEMGMLILANDPSVTLLEVTQTGLPLPVATEIPLSVFVTLPGDDPLYWFKYVKLTGTLQYDHNSGYYFLVDSESSTGILSLNPEAQQTLSTYIGMPINITGFTVMNFDEGGLLHIAFLNGPDDIEIREMTTEEKIDVIYYQLLNQFIQTPYHPGETIALPMTDKFYGSIIGWNHVGNSSNYIDLDTGLVNDQIDSYMTVQVELAITLEGLSKHFTLYIHIKPELMMVDIATLYTMPIIEVIMQVQIITEPSNGWMIISDGVHNMALYSSRLDVHFGDIIQVEGRLSSFNDNTFVNDYKDPITMILVEGQFVTNRALSMSLFDYQNLDMSILTNQYKAIQLVGTLGFDLNTDNYFIEDNGVKIPVIATTPEGRMALHMHLGNQVTLTGYSSSYSMGNQIIFLNHPNDIQGTLTNETIVENIKQQLIFMYSKTYRPGNYVYLETWLNPYYPSINYEFIGDQMMFDTQTGIINPNITEITSITFEVTIIYEGTSLVFSLNLSVEPLVLSTIDFIKTAPLGTIQNLEAVVLFKSYDESIQFMIVGDDTGYMVILGKHFYEMYDKVLLQGVVTEYEGEIALWVEAFQATYISSNNTIMTQPIPMTLLQATQVDMNSPYMTYITITGTIYADEFGISIYDDMTLEEVYFENIYEHHVFYNFNGLKVTIKAFIHYDSDTSQPVLYYSGGNDGIDLAYENDQEKMTALIGMGQEHFENTQYHPYETIDMPSYFGIFDAYLSYQILPGETLYVNDMIQWVEEVQTISLQVTILIGTYEEVVVYTITITPYSITNIIDVPAYEDDEFVVLRGTVRATEGIHAVIEDATGMIVVEGFTGFVVNDIVIIYGNVNYLHGTVSIHSYGEKALSVVVGYEASEPTLSEYSLYDTGLLDPFGASLAFYTTFEGVIQNRDGVFYLTNGIYDVQIITTNEDAHTLLLQMVNQLVSIQVYFVGIEIYQGLVISAVFTGKLNEYTYLQLTEEEIAAEILNYAIHKLDRPYYAAQVLNYPIEHPYFHGSITVINDGLNAGVIWFNQGVITVTGVETTYQTDITVEITYLGLTYSQLLTITISPYPIVTILDAITNHPGQLVYLKVVIAGMQYHFDTMVYVMDSTGVSYFIVMDESLHTFTGREIIISGYLYESCEGIPHIDQVQVHQILGVVNLGEPTTIMMSDFWMNGELNTSLMGTFVVFQGVVSNQGMEVVVNQGPMNIVLVGNLLLEYQNLKWSSGQVVNITGILVGYRMDFNTQQIMPLVAYIPIVG